MGENLLYSGVWDRAYEYFGAHPADEGWVFRVWAPHARHVALVGDFSGWEQWGMVRLEDGTWEIVDEDTKIFDDQALYEPGYVQVVYLKIENKGTVPFDFKTAVSVTDYTLATNVFGQNFQLQDYLKFGLATTSTEAEIYEMVATRNLAEEVANMPLSNYATEVASLDAGDEVYMALIVRMPEDVNNIANYRGDVIPKVELGLIVSATQQKN